MDTVRAYVETFERLRRRKRWSTDSSALRLCALSLATMDLDDPGSRLEETAAILRKRAGAFSPLNSAVRHAVAAMALSRGLDPARLVDRVKQTLENFKARKLRHRGAQPLLAAVLLVFDASGGAVPAGKIQRMKQILGRWKEDHPFLTGPDDYAMAALHAGREVSAAELGLHVEQIYQRLREARFRRGNQLQLVSHILAISPLGPVASARRFVTIAEALREKGLWIWQSRYDEIALLTLTEGRPRQIAAKVLDYRDRLREVKHRPDKSMALSIAAGLLLSEQARRQSGLVGAEAAASLRMVQALVEAQQAAVIAAIAASTAAATSAAH